MSENIISSSHLIEVKNLAHSFEYPLFKDINFSLNAMQSMAIVGSSGSGKSTLLHIISTLLKPNNGEVSLLNKDIYTLDEKEILSLRREEIGIIFQAHYLFRGFSAKENLDVSSILTNQDLDTQLLTSLKIDHVINQQVGELSGGQQQRVSIARVLNKKPKIIFADEPTGNLDSQTATEIMQIMFNYIKSNNAALILVTHDKDIASMCDNTYELKDNQLQLY